MYEIQIVSPSTAALYEKFTSPRLRHLLMQENQDTIVAVGILSCDQPAGLCLVEIRKNGQIGMIRSLFVVAHLRNMGLGKELLLYTEKILRDKGCLRVTIRFNTAKDALPQLMNFLLRCGWKAPELVMEHNKVDICAFAKEKWIYRLHLSEGYSITPWPQEGSPVLEDLKKNKWYPAYASPFMEHSLSIFLPASFLLWRRGELVGWVIVRQYQPHTIVCSTLFVKEALQGTGVGIVLLTESIKAVIAVQIPYAIFVLLHEAGSENPKLLRFSERRLMPFSKQISQTWKTYKDIDPVSFHLGFI